MDFEESISRLEEIVGELEASNLSLDSSLKLYEEGMHLSKKCQDKLFDAERKVYILKSKALDKKSDKRGRKKAKDKELGRELDKAIKDDFTLFKRDE